MATLSEIEKKYAAMMRSKNSPISFGEYARGQVGDIMSSAGEQRVDATLNAQRRLSDYGMLAESLEARGLSDSGFAKYARSAIEAERDKKLKEADSYEGGAIGKLKSSYGSYLDDFESKQRSLRKGVINELVKRGELNPENIYKYGAEAGLSEDAGKNLYNEVYKAASYYVKQSLLEEINAGSLSVDQAIYKAKSMMLLPDDVREIEEAAMLYHKNAEALSDEYLKELEALSDKSTVSYPAGILYIMEKMNQKKG